MPDTSSGLTADGLHRNPKVKDKVGLEFLRQPYLLHFHLAINLNF
jgi:hypothetical protein